MFKKKNFVILAMLVVVCGAVILNYQFQNEDAKLAATDVIENGEENKDKILGEALLVNGGKEGEKTDETQKPEDEGESKETASSVKGDYFAEARVNRQQTRDEAIELLKSITGDQNNSDDVKKKAADDLAAIAATMEKEASIETLVKAKGFEDCLLGLSENNVSVMVKTAGLEAPQVAQIKEIVISETALPGSSITIIEIK